KTTRPFVIVVLLSASLLHGEIIDRVTAIVNKHVITLSDVRLERNIRAALGESQPTDDKSILNDLIDRQIIDDQIAQFPNIEILDADIENELHGITDMRGLSPDVLRDAIRKRMLTSEFFNLRFRQFLQATDQEVRQYYEEKFLPEARKRGMNPIPP